MTDINSNPSHDCQLQVVYDSGQKPTIPDYFRHLFLRFHSAIRRRVSPDRSTPGINFSAAPGIGVNDASEAEVNPDRPDMTAEHMSFEPGEMVKIKLFDEITKTLDSGGRCEGLQFMPGMKKYCGQQARVLKRVRLIFDERLWKMVKTRHSYILEGITCDGRDVFDGEGCDRTCFFFWKDRWLQKIK